MERSSGRVLTSVLVDFARTLGTEYSVGSILDRLVMSVLEILPVTGAGVMLLGEQEDLHFVAASDDEVMLLETLQNELQEGPCRDACATGEAVQIPDASADDRYPQFLRRARAAGLAAVFTFPLRLEGGTLGALDLYRDTPGPLDEEDVRAAQTLADVAAAYTFNAQARVDASATMARLNHRSLHDPLTGLPNRALLDELLERSIARTRRSHLRAGVLFVDLDGFKTVNDRFGHHVGDELLVAVAERLRRQLRPGDVLGRLGGDEFVAVCEDLHTEEAADRLARRLSCALEEPFRLGERTVQVAASIGIAFADGQEEAAQALLRDADVAMYQAKASGGGRHRLLDPVARSAADDLRLLQQDVAGAAERGELRLVHQPVRRPASATGDDLVGVEALLRWAHPVLGEVPAQSAVAVAERTGAIHALGEWVLRTACAELQEWDEHGLHVPHVAVNVSADQVMRPAFPDVVRRVLDQAGTSADRLHLEVTETVFLSDTRRALAVLQEVADLGVALVLDDFGTGYSSMSYLRRYPFTGVKVDRSFVADVVEDRSTRAVVRAVVDLSHALGLSVTAEGVETPRQLQVLREMGADHVQGYLVGRPVPAAALARQHAAPVLPRTSGEQVPTSHEPVLPRPGVSQPAPGPSTAS